MWSNLISRFRDDERGVATVESLLWMPVFFFLFILMTDASFIFYGKAEALRIIQDGNRSYSVGSNNLETDGQAGSYIQGRLSAVAPNATASTNTVGGIITTTATIPASDLMAVGSIPGFLGIVVQVTAQHFKES